MPKRWQSRGGTRSRGERSKIGKDERIKLTVDQIRERFDKDVERFSTLETGQVAIVDAPIFLDLISRAAAATNPGAGHLLNVGRGAGNNALKLLQVLPDLNVTNLEIPLSYGGFSRYMCCMLKL